MAIKPHICGKNTVNLPTSGCSDCAELEYRIKRLEDWHDEFVEEGYNALANKPSINGVTVEGDKTSEDYLITAITDELLDSLTPIECYVPTCSKPLTCVGETECMQLECDPTSPTACEGTACNAVIACDNVNNGTETTEEEIIPTEVTEEE